MQEKQYYPINEEMARLAKMSFSFSDYVPNSTTEEYKAAVDHVWELVEQRKAKGDLTPEQVEKLEGYADRYARRLASWQNSYNANTASCPSVMICGAGNFPVRKKEKQNAREGRLWEEYEDIKKYFNWVENFVAGRISTAIMAGDANAEQQLETKIKDLTAKQEKMVAYNAYYRKHKSMEGYGGLSDADAAKIDETLAGNEWARQPYASCTLTNNRGKIKRASERLAQLRREKATQGREYDTTGLALRVEENKDTMRLQVFFEGKPGEETRTLLKSHAFKWAPSVGCWQRQLTNNARYDLKNIIKKLKELSHE